MVKVLLILLTFTFTFRPTFFVSTYWSQTVAVMALEVLNTLTFTFMNSRATFFVKHAGFSECVASVCGDDSGFIFENIYVFLDAELHFL